MASGNLSTAAAVPIKNAKGEIAMQKVKVQRYVTGKKPQYADDRALSSDESDEELADTIARRPENLESGRLLPNLAAVKLEEEEEEITPFSEDVIKSDRRLRRLIQRDGESSSSRRQIAEPEILALGEERRRPKRSEVESSDEELDEDNVERRHALLRQIKLEEEEEELHEKEHEGQSEDEDQESEYEEYTDSEDDMAPTRLKPVFTRKEQRITVLEKEKEEEAERLKDLKVKKEQEERRKYALKIIEDENKKEEQEKNEENDDAMLEASIAAVNTDDENEESSYELWKLRELKRIKRERDERDALMKEKLEIDKLRGMTEEERQAELEKNPKIVTNQADKGKYRYMQKYFHRGAFYLDEEQDVFKRDFAEPTLEDHFDKTILPKVMQVKNFGRSGRTKYTHLVDQDTTVFDSPWVAETSQSKKFVTTQAGGSKPIFERPSKRRKT